jgi:hypothetical protein
MSDPSHPLQVAMITALRASPDVAAIVGTRVYDQVPMNTTPVFPYVTLGEIQVLPDKAECIDGTELFPQVDAWSRRAGFPEVKALSAAILKALDDQVLTVSGYTVVVFELQNIQHIRDPDGLTRHAAITFHTLIEAQ